jgi:hypothetical protein
MMNPDRRIGMATIFVAAATLTATILVTFAVDTTITTPAFAQDENVTGGNVTEGNMTAPVLGDGGAPTPPAIIP